MFLKSANQFEQLTDMAHREHSAGMKARSTCIKTVSVCGGDDPHPKTEKKVRNFNEYITSLRFYFLRSSWCIQQACEKLINNVLNCFCS